MKFIVILLFLSTASFSTFAAQINFIYDKPVQEDYFKEDITIKNEGELSKQKLSFWSWVKRQFEASSEKETVATQMIFFDLGLLLNSHKQGGIGLGFNYERQIVPHLGVRGYFGQTIIFKKENNRGCISFLQALFAEFYPMSRQLRKLYIATGLCWDLIHYTDNNTPKHAQASTISIYPQIGYKFSLPWRFLLDVFCGYKFPITTNGIYYGNTAELLGCGFQWGFLFKHYMKVRN